MGDSLDDEVVDRVREFAEGRKIYSLECGRGNGWVTWNENDVACFQGDTGTESEAWNRFQKIEPGDIIIAHKASQSFIYGAGVAQAAYSSDQPVITDEEDLDDALTAYQLPVWWATIQNRGEDLTEFTETDFSYGTVDELSTHQLVELFIALEEKDFPDSGDSYFELLVAAANSNDLEELIDSKLPYSWKDSHGKKTQIKAVVRKFLTNTDSDSDTKDRRKEAQQRVADRRDVTYNTVQSKCGRETWAERVEGNNYHEDYFDPALEKIEAQWKNEESQQGEEAYFALTTGNSRYNDDPENEYRFYNGHAGTKKLRRAANAGRIVYYETGEFFATASLGDVNLEIQDDDDWNSYIEIEDYEEIDAVELDEIESALTVDFPQQFGIVKVPYEDFSLMTGRKDESTGRSLAEFRADFDELLAAESRQAELYREALAHLVAGKNLLFYGPPGTGKTRAANLLTDVICEDETIVTANAEWSNHKVVGGYEPAGDSWTAEPGFLTEAAHNCRESLANSGRPEWLIIDELNRANLDEAFGDVFTLLDIEYRDDVPINFGGEPVFVPLAFRIIGTMNTYDQAQLFSLGYAFRRRFAFVHVPSLLNKSELDESPSLVEVDSRVSIEFEQTDRTEYVVDIVRDEIPKYFQRTSERDAEDVATIFPEVESANAVSNTEDSLLTDENMHRRGLDFIEAVAVFAQEVSNRDVIDIGQALVIDAARFVVAHQVLFPEETDWEIVDRAMVSYIVPQFEQFMADLRRAETINPDSNAAKRFGEVITIAEQLGFNRAARVLKQAMETKQILNS